MYNYPTTLMLQVVTRIGEVLTFRVFATPPQDMKLGQQTR
jgi:hypothetical protein